MFSDPIKLNKSQRQAIEYTSGPLLIVAGAGTGKTTTLVEKIKHIINKKLARPEEILCLTFTEKAAYEMEERVDRAMPYGFFQMWISTFHSFADDVLRDELHHLGLNPSYTLMSQAQSILFMRKHLYDFHLNYFRPLSNPNKFIAGLLQHFSRLQDEDISPEEYEKWVKRMCHPELVSGSSDSENKKLQRSRNKFGMTNTAMSEDERQQLQELASAYKTYQHIKMDHDVMDFGDLIFYLNKLFRTRPSVLKQYQKKFKYILVDEFQDTNIAQYELIKLLCPPSKSEDSSSGKSRLTVVGDDSQAIYKFRGASVSNILTFMKDYKRAKQVTLNDNYRSNQTILDHAYNLIQHNNPDTLESRLGISKKLISHTKDRNDASMMKVFRHGDDEADWVVNEIAKLFATRYPLSSIAILVRANNHSESFIRALKHKGIPYQFLGPGRLFKQPQVKDLIAYLHVLADLSDTISLYRVLSMDLFKIDSEDLLHLMSFAKKTSLSYYQAIEVYLSFYHDEWYEPENKRYKEYMPLIGKATKDTLIDVFTLIKKQVKRIRKDTAGELLFSFLKDTGYIDILGNPETQMQEQATFTITKFFGKIREMERSQEDTSVFGATEYIDMSMELGESPLAGEADFTTLNAVHILTVHSAKGLEFPIVFMPNLIKGRFPTYRRRQQIPLPDDLIKETLPQGDYHAQEERRLFYVGMTRAKDRLFLTASERYDQGVRKRKLSPFVYEAMGEDALSIKPYVPQDTKQQLSIFDFQKHDDVVIPKPVTIKNISYSQLQTYKVCPLQYKYQYVLKIPSSPVAAASFGSTVHNALHKFYKGFAKDSTKGLGDLLALLEESWIPIGFSSTKQATKMKQEAREMLENYYTSFHTPEIKIIDLEKMFKIRIGSTEFLTGKIDRVDKKAGGAIEIIDYKTGSMPDEKKLKKNLQLTIYAMAANSPALYNKPVKNIDLTFYYLQAREKVTMKPSKDDMTQARKQITNTVEAIRKGSFEPRVGRWCKHCSFRMICEAWK